VLFTLQELEPRVRAQPVPPGVWIPSTLPSEDSTPPSLDRTVVPSSAVAAGLDQALSNTPVSASSLSSTPAPALRPRAPLPAPATGGPGGATWLPVLAGASLMSLLVLVGVVALASLFGPEPAPAPAPVVAAPQPAPAPPPALAAPAILTLRTDPPGAEVWEGDVRHGLTPLELVLTGGPVDEPRELVLKLDGYAPHTVRQPWTDRSVQHSVALQRVARPEPKRPTRPSPALPVREER
jgi:hypothetical protein